MVACSCHRGALFAAVVFHFLFQTSKKEAPAAALEPSAEAAPAADESKGDDGALRAGCRTRGTMVARSRQILSCMLSADMLLADCCGALGLLFLLFSSSTCPSPLPLRRTTGATGNGGAAEGSSASGDAGNDGQGGEAPPPAPAKPEGGPAAAAAATGPDDALSLETVAVTAPVVQRSAPHLLLAQFPAEFSQLVADMCLDRGLDDTARQQLRDLLTFDDVLAVMSSPTEPLRKRAGYCEVMRCLHVDAAPQFPMAMFRSRVSSLGGAVYPAPGASSMSLHVLLHTVQHILFRGPDFQTGTATFGEVGAWRRCVCV